MLRCINCHLCVDRMLRHIVGSFQSAMQALLATWTPMEQLPPESVICQECFSKLYGHFRNNNMNAQRELGHTKVCLGCGKSIMKSKRCIRHHRLDVNDPLTAIILSWDIYNEVTTSCAFVCHSCWIHANRQRSQDLVRGSPAIEIEPQLNDSDEIFVPRQEIPLPPLPPPPPPPSLQEQQIPTAPVSIIILPHYKRLSNTSRHCIFQGCGNQSNHLVPLLVKVMLLKQFHIYVPTHSRVCEMHLYAYEWSFLNDNANLFNSFSAQQVEDLIRIIERNSEYMNFEDVNEMPNHICHYWTSLNVSEFLSLYNEIPVLSNVKYGKTCLAIYLTKLRTGDSDERLSTLYNMKRSTLQSCLKKMRNYFINHFVPLHIGLQHITREEVAMRNLMIPSRLFVNPNTPPAAMPAIVICDGTYIFVQKSSNYLFQKKTYSLHKYENLIKPFIIVSCDGHIIDVSGPYAATDSDAKIITKLFENESGPMRSFFKSEDIFILDRGFRDSIPVLEIYGYKVFKPETINQGQTQLTTLQEH